MPTNSLANCKIQNEKKITKFKKTNFPLLFGSLRKMKSEIEKRSAWIDLLKIIAKVTGAWGKNIQAIKYDASMLTHTSNTFCEFFIIRCFSALYANLGCSNIDNFKIFVKNIRKNFFIHLKRWYEIWHNFRENFSRFYTKNIDEKSKII